MQKLKSLRLLPMLAIPAMLVACEDDLSNIGQDLVKNEVMISVDSTTYNVNGRTVEGLSLDTRSTVTLLGTINTPDYGQLSCSFVSQFLPATALLMPDTIPSSRVTDTKLVLRFPTAGITGDSLAPQQVKVYRLSSDLPEDLSSSWNPEGHYDPKAIAQANYTLSGMAIGDTTVSRNKQINIGLSLGKSTGIQAIEQYRSNPTIFQWPYTFVKKYKGLYLKSSFGKGCVANINNASVYAYYQTWADKLVENDEGVSEVKAVEVIDSVCLFTTAPEVLSASLLKYTTSRKIDDLKAKGKAVITTPGGYISQITFPAEDLLKKDYWTQNPDLAVINNIKFTIPAKAIENDLGINVAPSLLMVKASEAKEFFTQSKVPDNVSSFIADYSSTSGCYEFSSMRSYIIEMAKKGGNIPAEDVEFMLIPVNPTYEQVTNNDGTTVTYVTSCVPYVVRPTMTLLDTEKSLIVFTFTNQIPK